MHRNPVGRSVTTVSRTFSEPNPQNAARGVEHLATVLFRRAANIDRRYRGAATEWNKSSAEMMCLFGVLGLAFA
jgi:hypothetical protein